MSKKVLQAIQDTLEEDMGVDIQDWDDVHENADKVDPNKVAERAGIEPEVAKKTVNKWIERMKGAYKQKMDAEKKNRRPRWRCAVCGRLGCPVAPYIDGYDEV